MHKLYNFEHNGTSRSLYYDDNYFKINADNLSLAKFINIKPSDKLLVEFGSGLFIIPLLLSCDHDINIVGVEKDEKACMLSLNTIKYNGLSDNLSVINDNVQNILKYFKINSVDIVVCNPPYFSKSKQSLVSLKEEKAIARHDSELSLNDVFYYANLILKNNGGLFIIERVDNLFEINDLLRQYGFAIKRMQFIYPNVCKKAKLVMIEARKNGKETNLFIDKPFVLEGNDLGGEK